MTVIFMNCYISYILQESELWFYFSLYFLRLFLCSFMSCRLKTCQVFTAGLLMGPRNDYSVIDRDFCWTNFIGIISLRTEAIKSPNMIRNLTECPRRLMNEQQFNGTTVLLFSSVVFMLFAVQDLRTLLDNSC